MLFVLWDQKKFAGLGNYIKNDVLYLSKVSPFRKVNNITDLERVAVETAKSIIVISEYQASADLKEKIKSDDRAIKTLMAIESCTHQQTNKPDIIVEGFTKHRLNLMRLINPNIIIVIDKKTM